MPNPVNERLDFPRAFDRAKALSKSLGNGQYTELFIEDVGYQAALIQHLNNNNVPAEGVKVAGQDKRSRLALVTHLIQQGRVVFPRKGAEELISQLVGFGIEKHDDLADAFSLLLLKVLEKDEGEPGIYIYSMGSVFDKGTLLSAVSDTPLSLDMKF